MDTCAPKGLTQVDDRTVLDEAYARLHRTGPEFSGYLSNHGPMAVEALIRHGHGGTVHRWLDGYVRRLEPFPATVAPIGADWHGAMGNWRRVADWTRYFEAELAEAPWPAVLNRWWPRLLPGIAAGATHGVIRVGHAVRSLLADGDGPAPLRVDELAQGLAYWAARWQPTAPVAGGWPAPSSRSGAADLAQVLNALPRLTSADGQSFDKWVGRMADVPGWSDAARRATVPQDPVAAREWLARLVDLAVIRYGRYGHGSPIMLVHSATAPQAVWRILPALDRELWRDSAIAAWVAVASLTAIYAPAAAAAEDGAPRPAPTADDAFAEAAAHGDEHVIKFADTALASWARTKDPGALAAIRRARTLIPPAAAP